MKVNVKKLEKSTLQEIQALKKKFDLIKTETEEFIESAKRLSSKGADEAQDLLESAKKNWHSLIGSFDASSISKFFSKTKSKVSKARMTTKKKSAAKPRAKKSATAGREAASKR